MTKIFQQIGLEPDIFYWLQEEKAGRRHKNLSQTINELIKNYQIMVRGIQKAVDDKEKMEKRVKESEDFAKAYRSQIIKKEENNTCIKE